MGFAVHTYDPRTNSDRTFDVGESVSTVVRRAPEKGGGLVVALTRSIAHLDEESGKLTKICDVPEPASNRLNDGKCDPLGRLWIGSMAFDFKHGAGSLYMLDLDGTLHTMIESVTISNGIVWTKDRRTMYYIDSEENEVDAFDFDLDSGAIGNRRQAIKNVWGGTFDGMTIDSEDNLFVAIWGGSAVLKIDPKNAELLEKTNVPGVLNVTSCAFGGEQLRDLYITSSADGADLDVHKNAGALFRTPVSEADGVPAFEFNG